MVTSWSRSDTGGALVADQPRWGFEEYKDWDDEPAAPASKAPPEDEPTLNGTDPDGVVEVLVTANAEIAAVRLSRDWRRALDPRALDGAVLAAANTATMRALAKSVEENPIEPSGDAEGTRPAETGRLSTADVQRLLDSVHQELAGFTRKLASAVDRPAEVESSGRHVRGTAERGHFTTLTIDPLWAGQVRHTEIESELTEVLRELHSASTPGELAAGPQGPAVAELMDLARDPELLMRRLGMPSS
jgi:predicted transcriptional regulator